MTELHRLSPDARRALRSDLERRYHDFQARGLSLDMTRGKPCAEQLDLSVDMLTCVDANHYTAADGSDCRNYGGLDGIPEAKVLFAQYLEVAPEEVIIGGASSLNMMHDAILSAMVYGAAEGYEPWGRRQVKFLCPSPGYDRHFAICERLGIEMIPVEMGDDGPDMDAVERLAAADEGVVGIWCVPCYSNPTGIVYGDEVVDRLAAMPTAAPDFRIYWDNAYAVHHLTDNPTPLKNILTACKAASHPDRPLIFGSTSKVTFAGAGLAMMAGSVANTTRRKAEMSIQTIGPDKLNQLRHVRFLRDMDGIRAQMRKHAAILKPKFDAVDEILTRELAGKGVASWTKPKGGYFVSLDTLDGCAKEVIARAAKAGVRLTPAGSTYPYKRDPRDRNIRIAPSFPPLEDIVPAMELLAICVQLVSLERLMG
ncbi:MAG: aminotransferase class I/II-fold pyridoxal phosphate-dependent enzyme [Chloroflexi bacterium]|nr:aminotransferase class I/II-fold pyridoxal phosphate-dependent enzyme [Chloroflexota bacterium]